MNPLRIQYNGLTIEEGTGYVVTNIEGLDGVEIRTSKDDLAGRDGGNIWAQNYGMRDIIIEGMIYAQDVTTYFSLVNAFNLAFAKVSSATALTIRLWDGSEKSTNARVVTPPLLTKKAGEVTHCYYRIELLCEDPYFSDTTETVYTTGLYIAGGTTIPATIPITFTSSSGGIINIVNSGDIETEAQFEIKGLAINPTVLNRATSQQFQIQTTVNVGETVYTKIDNKGFSCMKNNTANYIQYFKGTFFKLQKGNNPIVFSASNFDSSSQLTVRFRAKYLNIK